MRNALVYWWVLSLLLNWSSNVRSLMCFNNPFHNVCTEYENVLAANVFLLTFDILSIVPLLLDLIFSLVFCLMVISSHGYPGAMLSMHLNVRVNIFYCIHCHIGGQWSVLSASVELEYLDLFNAILAQMFWMVWNLFNAFFRYVVEHHICIIEVRYAKHEH